MIAKVLYIAIVYKCDMFISNTSTLILLAKINALTLLLDDIKRAFIPKIVYEEIKGKDSFEIMLIEKEIEKGRIKIENVDKNIYKKIIEQFKLDEGEAAAYALFKQKKGKALLTDDGELIRLCKIENVPFIVAIAVVVRLFKKGKIKKDDALEKLSKLYGYGRYSEDVYKYFKSKVK